MKRITIFFILLVFALTLCSCSTNQSPNSKIQISIAEDSQLTEVEQARNSVIEKWENERDAFDTPKFIEDYYKEFYNDEVIANIYFYCTAKNEYDLYVSLGDNKYLTLAKEYAIKIDPNYSGTFSAEMHQFVQKIVSSDDIEQSRSEAMSKEDKYNSLTKSEKKKICNYIEKRYSYYDTINGGYSGDKYSDKIMQEAADKYGLSVSQIEIIWMNSYSY